jgi:hypothetical protein
VTVLALATLGSAMKNRNDTISVAMPNLVKASAIVTVGCPFYWCVHLKNVAKGHELKQLNNKI